MSEPELEIFIPHYHRRQELLRLLRSLEGQGRPGEWRVRIADNASGYDVSASLREAGLSEELLRIVEVQERPYNVGGDINFAMGQMECRAEWQWTIGDDDLALPGSVAAVLDEVGRHPEAHFICFHTAEESGWRAPHFGDAEYLSISEFCRGVEAEVTFMSSNVYHIGAAREYLGGIFDSIETHFPDQYVPLAALSSGYAVRSSARSIVRQQPGCKPGFELTNLVLRQGDYAVSSRLKMTDDDLRAYQAFLNKMTPKLHRALPDGASRRMRWEVAKRLVASFGLNGNTLGVLGVWLCPWAPGLAHGVRNKLRLLRGKT